MNSNSEIGTFIVETLKCLNRGSACNWSSPMKGWFSIYFGKVFVTQGFKLIINLQNRKLYKTENFKYSNI